MRQRTFLADIQPIDALQHPLSACRMRDKGKLGRSLMLHLGKRLKPNDKIFC
ncbi:hypothetical protein RGR602_PB00305 (plasmid) [Rhizobium gallicum bv. gallicum R602sp]|uniref:Uncharacterized protein n=1 Tax=Rhizobium gallicum bv. gallicum R602sp TaxID=1041138 RepID=A0A0B4X711_9HYPH|nr:hypothetical protein RGR602_PB00305 [Rhizobium gallicum bv. gallicum R602sp]